VVDGYRESTQSWRELLGQLKRLGLSAAPKLVIDDNILEPIEAKLKELFDLPQPERKTIDLEGRVVKDGVRKALRDRQLAFTDLVHAIQGLPDHRGEQTADPPKLRLCSRRP
jgi:hypothetical protein